MANIFWLSFGLIALSIGIFSIGKPIGGWPAWLSPWVFHLGSISAGLLSMIKWMTMKTFMLREDELVVSTLFGLRKRIIPRSQILGMIELEKMDEDSKWRECTLLTNYGKFKFSEQMHTSYSDIMHILQAQWKVKREASLLNKELSKNKLIQGIVNLAIAALIFLGLQQIKAIYEIAPKNELIEIKSRIVNDISLTPDTDKVTSLLLEAYPGLNFMIDSYAKSVMNKSDFEQISVKNDSIILTISQKDHRKKLVKSEPLNILEQYINYPNVTIYGIRNNATLILNPDDYLSAVNGLGGGNSWGGSFFLYLLIFMFTASGAKSIYEFMMSTI